MNDYNKKFEEIRINLDDSSNGLIANLERSKNAKTEIDSLKKASDDQLTQRKRSYFLYIQTTINTEYFKENQVPKIWLRT